MFIVAVVVAVAEDTEVVVMVDVLAVVLFVVVIDVVACACLAGLIAASLIHSKRVSSWAGRGVTTKRIEYDMIPEI